MAGGATRGWARRVAGVAVGVALVPTLAGCTGTNASAWVGSTDPAMPVMAVNADSITYYSYNQVLGLLGPDFRMKVDARVNARADEHLASAATYDEIDPVVVIVALGTNDLVQGQPVTDLRSDQLQILDNYGPTVGCVVYMTVFGDKHPYAVDSPEVDAYNAAVRALDGSTELGVTVQVADWEQAVYDAGPDTVIADDVHPNDAGKVIFADLLRAAVDECPAVPQPGDTPSV